VMSSWTRPERLYGSEWGKTQVLHKNAVTLLLEGRSMPGDLAPPQGGPMGAVLGVLLRNYGFTDLPPS
jgi:hypothetical protein